MQPNQSGRSGVDPPVPSPYVGQQVRDPYGRPDPELGPLPGAYVAPGHYPAAGPFAPSGQYPGSGPYPAQGQVGYSPGGPSVSGLPAPSASPTLYELRPDSTTFWRGVGSRALIFLPLVALGIYNGVQRNGVGWVVVLYVGLAAILLVGVLIMLQTSSIVLTATTVEKHRLLLRPKIVQRAAVARGVLVPQYTSSFNRTAPLLVLVGNKGRSLLRVTGQVFDAGGVFTLAERIGLQSFDVISGVVGPKAVAKRHKKILPLFERRPMLVVVVGTVLLLVLIVVGITIFDPVSD